MRLKNLSGAVAVIAAGATLATTPVAAAAQAQPAPDAAARIGAYMRTRLPSCERRHRTRCRARAIGCC